MSKGRKTLLDDIKDPKRNGRKSLPREEYPEDKRGDSWEPPPEAEGTQTLDPPAELGECPANPWPAEPSPAAYRGLAGDIVRAIEPHSEADSVALLIQTLTAYGSMVGRTAHFCAEDDFHYLNLFGVLVGKTSKGRKGSSWGRVRKVVEAADSEWAGQRVQSGLSSGEGLIWAVRDPLTGREKIKEGRRVTGFQDVELDPGVSDKRLLVYEPEFALVLKQIERQGNTLSAILRQAWDSGKLRTLTKNSPTKATGAHISLVGHITVDELRRYLSATESANGFGNRFLWLCVRRSKILPEGGSLNPETIDELRRRLSEAVDFGRDVGTMRRDLEARELWGSAYANLSEGKPGLTGALLARAEAQVMRLACLYALMDLSCHVEANHLRAALALWSYCDQSVKFVFGDSLGDPVADEILRALRNTPTGLARNQVRELFGRHRTSDEIGRALGSLLEYGLARMEQKTTGGRPEERWFAQNGSARGARKAP